MVKGESQSVVAIFNVAMIGHVNPTFALVQELVQRGCKVHYFLPPNNDIRSAAQESGAQVEAYLAQDPQDLVLEKCDVRDDVPADEKAMWERAVWPLASTLLCGEYLIQRCKELGVEAVLYDPMAPHGLVVAKALGLPCASLVTYPGMGSLTDLMNDLQRDGRLAKAMEIRKDYSKAILEKFHVDVQDQMLTRRQYFASENFITTCAELVAPLPTPGEMAWADELRANFEFTAVGSMVSEAAPHVAKACSKLSLPDTFGCDLPTKELEDAARRGAKVVYVALGTMALSDRWGSDLGRQSAGNLPVGTTGKQFCQHVWAALLKASELLGEDYLFVMCVGTQPDAMDFMKERVQVPNVVLRSSLPQVEILSKHADVFISHCGFNSLQESLMLGVPLIAVPQSVDQPINAQKVQSCSWGQAFLHPMETVTPSSLAQAVQDVVVGSNRKAVEEVRVQLLGGAGRVADRLLQMSRDSKKASFGGS
mmetsp:Transcript_106901/g.190004  ORF Transcript_106901/g.190004 Transcript_106901/m.190004 type:complete len:480 (-) Transcript_106901:153-1592(-)|eukprot:CAMPEP_0197632076 /NCGR_PEP_ID=MMETSP1338-20131121/8999_1 /TAXON_ID=43686 ORGANISM="Pelagodinium beii, Strain RCC1491" /NCGR_SAMPLE_ID=MMETSP1338 /ASSEMBLY_ACC=CAM_ASM_000754 /LENGTH=479 /DNA_ID=CAMNT_0043203625 /DNA_START=57 /DNA_END=1496 /DNA_ORIENTATION=-